MKNKLEQKDIDILLDPFTAVLTEIETQLIKLSDWGNRHEAEGAEIALVRIAEFVIRQSEALFLTPAPKTLLQIYHHVADGLKEAHKAAEDESHESVVKELEETWNHVANVFVILFTGLYTMKFRSPEQIRTQLETYRHAIEAGGHQKLFGEVKGMVIQ